MNYKYDELTYAKMIYDKGFQTKHIPTELRLLVLYFRDMLEMKPKAREFKIYEFCYKYMPDFKKESYFRAINKALKAGVDKQQKLIVIDKINIYQNEVDYINSLNIEYNYKKVMFTFLVQAKLNREVCQLKYNKEYDTSYFRGGRSKYNTIKKMSNIPAKILLHDEVIHNLDKAKLVTIMYRGIIHLDYMNDCIEDGGVAIEVTDFENVGLSLDYYNGVPGVIKCESCGRIIKKKNNKQKYCEECAENIHKEIDRRYQAEKYSRLIEKSEND